MIRYKRQMALLLAGLLMGAGGATANPWQIHAQELPNASAASGRTYDTHGGIATMGTGTAGIVVSGNSGQTMVGKKFNVYKLFNAENAVGGESINYTFNPACEQALKIVAARGLSKDGQEVRPETVTEYMVIDYIQTLNTNPVEGTQTGQELEGSYSLFRYFVEEVRAEMVSLKVAPDVVNVRDVRSDKTVRLTGLDYGYYIIDEVTAVEETHSAGSLCMVDTANPTASIDLKSDYPTVTKKIKEDNECKDIEDQDRWNDIGDYEIGQTVPFRYDSNIPNMNGYDTYYYAWHDIMDAALTFQKKTVKIVINGKEASGKQKSYQLAKGEFEVTPNPGNGDTFQIAVADIKSIVDREFNQMNELGENIYGQSVTLTYEAVLNDRAAEDTGRPGFENDVRLEFSNDADADHAGSTGYTPWDTVVCFTYKLNVQKTNNHDKALADAKFRLYSDKECKNEVYVKEGRDSYIVINRDSTGGTDHIGGTEPPEATEMSSSQNGTLTIYGLDGETYYLKETDAPDGYRPLLDPIVLQLKATFTAERGSYVKGDGATDQTLKALEATAHVQSFYEGVTQNSDHILNTDINSGSANLTVVNQVGRKLPVTGNSAVLIILTVGAGMMGAALIKSRKKKEKGTD